MLRRKTPAPPDDPQGYPNDPEAERGVLREMIVNPVEALPKARAMLSEGDFFDPRHRLTFSALLGLSDRGRTTGNGDAIIDGGSLASYLRNRGELDAAGGPAYIGLLIHSAVEG